VAIQTFVLNKTHLTVNCLLDNFFEYFYVPYSNFKLIVFQLKPQSPVITMFILWIIIKNPYKLP